MNSIELKERLCRLDPYKKCLEFLAKRICSSNYRGVQISQHNRYTEEDVKQYLLEMFNVVQKGEMKIRDTDISKRPEPRTDELKYVQYTNKIKNMLGKGTQDSIRKNIFVDLSRMGLLDRYDENKNFVDPFSQSKHNVKYVKLSIQALDLIDNLGDVQKSYFLYSKAINKMTKGLENRLYNIIQIYDLKKITLIEFVFFLSFLDMKIDNEDLIYSEEILVNYILEFRSLSVHVQEAVINIVKEFCDPKAFVDRPKNEKRDFHNWMNEGQQIFNLMDQTFLFEYIEKYKYLILRAKVLSETQSPKLLRSSTEKDEYFKKHNISKEVGFELHHIIPLFKAKSLEQFYVLDTRENMIYIDAKTHSIISQTNNLNTRLEFVKTDVKLIDDSKVCKDIYCKYRENVLYNPLNKEKMIEFNYSINGW